MQALELDDALVIQGLRIARVDSQRLLHRPEAVLRPPRSEQEEAERRAGFGILRIDA